MMNIFFWNKTENNQNNIFFRIIFIFLFFSNLCTEDGLGFEIFKILCYKETKNRYYQLFLILWTIL